MRPPKTNGASCPCRLDHHGRPKWCHDCGARPVTPDPEYAAREATEAMAKAQAAAAEALARLDRAEAEVIRAAERLAES